MPLIVSAAQILAEIGPNEEALYDAWGLRGEHYERLLSEKTKAGDCLAQQGSCGRPAHRMGLCGTHHRRFLNLGEYGDWDAPIRPRLPNSIREDGSQRVTCGATSEDCPRPLVANGLCQGHYTRWRRWVRDGRIAWDQPLRAPVGAPAQKRGTRVRAD